MSRLPLRLRLTLAFGLAMAVVLAATGLVVYGIFRSDLNQTIDNSLRARASELASSRAVTGTGEDFALVLGTNGAVLASSPQVRGERLLTPSDIARAPALPVRRPQRPADRPLLRTARTTHAQPPTRATSSPASTASRSPYPISL